jgi:hypothetical protein
MKVTRKILFFDTLIQGLLIAMILAPLLLILILQAGEWILFSLYGMVLLGAWQLLSNLLWLLGRKDDARKYYLLAVLLYFAAGWLMTTLLPTTGAFQVIAFLYWFILPFGMAIWYFRLSIYQLLAYAGPPRSFWDI